MSPITGGGAPALRKSGVQADNTKLSLRFCLVAMFASIDLRRQLSVLGLAAWLPWAAWAQDPGAGLPLPPRFPDSLAGLEHTAAPVERRHALAASGSLSVNTQSRDEVRLFYRTVFAAASQVPSEFSGNVAACSAGDTSPAYKAATADRINWFRAMAGVPANVQFDATFSAKAQQAALMMAANRTLNHFPPTTFACYTANGAEAAGKSNLDQGRSGPNSIAGGYMHDFGSTNSAVGHRRWVLYPNTQFMGTGDVDTVEGGQTLRFNALWVQDANIFGSRPATRDAYVAWPPRGYVPHTVVYPRWSFSFPQADFSQATVAMTENGATISARKEPVANGFGDNTLVWLPGNYSDGMTWARPGGDTVYTVTISNVLVGGQARSFNYQVIVFDPDVATGTEGSAAVSGPATLAVGQSGAFSIAAVAGATGYEWRSLSTSSGAPLGDNAEAGTGNFVVTTSVGYNVQARDIVASGGASFHLAHTAATDQILQWKQTLVSREGASLVFASRLGLSSPSQLALVEVSIDDGVSWTALYTQAGQQTGSTSSFGETAFSTRTVSLAAYVGRTIQLRWRYTYLLGGTYYPQSSAGIGWYIDDISFGKVDVVQSVSAAVAVGSAGFNFSGAQAGNVALQARPGMFGVFGEWGPAALVTLGNDVATPATAFNCLFDFAELAVPTLLPRGPVTQVMAPYTFRFYPSTNSYLAVSSADSHLYYLVNGQLKDLGPYAAFLAAASCPAL